MTSIIIRLILSYTKYLLYLRYTNEYLLQLAILPGSRKPADLDSFLRPIVNELKDLSEYGLVVKRNQTEICRAKVHLLICSGDIPAVADMAHLGSHNSSYGCRICETKGRSPDNRSHGMYFEDCKAPLRPLRDFLNGNPVSLIIKSLSSMLIIIMFTYCSVYRPNQSINQVFLVH